jgi:hypothetical protein
MEHCCKESAAAHYPDCVLKLKNHKKNTRKNLKNSEKIFHGNKFVNGAMRFLRRGLFSPPWAIV